MALTQPRAAPALDSLLADARSDSAEFPHLLANHAPMILVALDRLGASDEQATGFLATYRATNGLVRLPASAAPVAAADWPGLRGQRDREADLRAFFTGEVARRGVRATLAAALPTLLPGIGASALHALMRLAYGLMRQDDAEIGAALGMWAATFLPMPPAGGTAAITDDPGAVLAGVAALPSLRHVTPESDLLWHSIKAVGADPAFAPVVDWLAIGPETPRRLAATALRLYAATMDFTALHAVTGLHWCRLLVPFCTTPEAVYRPFWQAIAALVPKLGFPALPDEVAVARWRQQPCPGWPAIAAAAVASDDEHDISLVFSSREEEAVWGDRLYRIVAARRMGLIA